MSTRAFYWRRVAQERAAHGHPVPDDVRRSLAALANQATAGDGVIDIFEVAGLSRVRLDTLSPEVLDQLRSAGPDEVHLAVEQLRNLLAQEVSHQTSGNLVRGKYFADRMSEAMNKYTNANLTAVQVIAELFEMAKEVSEGARRGEQYDPPLGNDELAVYDALSDNESAEQLPGDATLAQIARELIGVLRRDSKMDWTVRDDVKAKLRSSIRRLLVKYKYPPDKRDDATQLVLDQLEVLAPRYAA